MTDRRHHLIIDDLNAYECVPAIRVNVVVVVVASSVVCRLKFKIMSININTYIYVYVHIYLYFIVLYQVKRVHFIARINTKFSTNQYVAWARARACIHLENMRRRSIIFGLFISFAFYISHSIRWFRFDSFCGSTNDTFSGTDFMFCSVPLPSFFWNAPYENCSFAKKWNGISCVGVRIFKGLQAARHVKSKMNEQNT